jgi:hypothetical protein
MKPSCAPLSFKRAWRDDPWKSLKRDGTRAVELQCLVLSERADVEGDVVRHGRIRAGLVERQDVIDDQRLTAVQYERGLGLRSSVRAERDLVSEERAGGGVGAADAHPVGDHRGALATPDDLDGCAVGQRGEREGGVALGDLELCAGDWRRARRVAALAERGHAARAPARAAAEGAPAAPLQRYSYGFEG